MGCIGNMPGFKYVTVESLVITYNSTPYPIKTFVTNKKYIVWNIDRPYQLEDTNVRPESSLLEYLIVINDNGKPTIVEHEELLYSFDQTTNGSNLTGSTEYNTLKSQVDKNTTKFNLVSNTVDDMTQIIGATEELEDGSIIYNLNKVKSDSESYGISIGEIQTKVDDKYAEIKHIILNDLVEYLRSVSEYKLSFTNISEDTLITTEEVALINKNKGNMLENLNKLQLTLDDLKKITDSVNDIEKSQLIIDIKNKLYVLQNALMVICDAYLQDFKISGEEKTNIIKKAYELTTYIGIVQNTCTNITVNGQAGVVYSIENELLILKDKTSSTIKELDNTTSTLYDKYSNLTQDVLGFKLEVESRESQNKQNIRCNNLGLKINYSNFETINYGWLYLHGYNDKSNSINGDGVIYWGGNPITISKGAINPSTYFGFADCYLCTSIDSGGTFIAYYSDGWKFKWVIGSSASGDLDLNQTYITFGQFKMNGSGGFEYAYLYSSPMKLENAIGISNLETRLKNAELKITDDSITSLVGQTYLSQVDASKTYSTQSQLTQTSESLKATFSGNSAYNLLRGTRFVNKDARQWNYWGGAETWADKEDFSDGYLAWGVPYNSEGGMWQDEIRIEPNTQYTLSTICSWQTNCRGVDFVIEYSMPGGSIQTQYIEVKNLWWTRQSISFITPLNVEWCKAGFRHKGSVANRTDYLCFLKEPCLSKGTVSTWSPYPDEVIDGIITLDRSGITIDQGYNSCVMGSQSIDFFSSGTHYSRIEGGKFMLTDHYGNMIGEVGRTEWDNGSFYNGLTAVAGQTVGISTQLIPYDRYYVNMLASSYSGVINNSWYVEQGLNLINPYVHQQINFRPYDTNKYGDSGMCHIIYDYRKGHGLGIVGNNEVVLGVISPDGSHYAGFYVTKDMYAVGGTTMRLNGQLDCGGYPIINTSIQSSLKAQTLYTRELKDSKSLEGNTYVNMSFTQNEIRYVNREPVSTYEEYNLNDNLSSCNSKYICYCELPIFMAENIESNYHINISKMSFGDYRIIEKNNYYFILESEKEGFTFTYEVVAKQIETQDNNVVVANTGFVMAENEEETDKGYIME